MVGNQLCSVCKNIVTPGIDKFVVKYGKIVCRLCNDATKIKSKQKYNKTGKVPKKKVTSQEEIDLWNALGIDTNEDREPFMKDEISMSDLVEYNRIYLIERLAGLEDFEEVEYE